MSNKTQNDSNKREGFHQGRIKMATRGGMSTAKDMTLLIIEFHKNTGAYPRP